MSAEAAVAALFTLFEEHGQADYVGEPVSQLQHMVQAAQLARQDGADDELVLAAFCHDVGHFCGVATERNCMGDFGRKAHEQVGSHWLHRLGFPLRLCGLVEGHVRAKRYLCWRDAEYLASLSPASLATLAWQGGPLSTSEARAFEQDPLFADSLRLRYWDEAAKHPNSPTADVEWLRALALRVHRQAA